jgi:hypothetical protein
MPVAWEMEVSKKRVKIQTASTYVESQSSEQDLGPEPQVFHVEGHASGVGIG